MWLRSAAHPRLWLLNQLYVEGPQPDLTADALIAELDRGLADVAHRRAIVTHEATGRALAGPMRDVGYVVVPLMVMLFDDDAPPPPPGEVREVDHATMHALLAELADDSGEIPVDDRPVVVEGNAYVGATIPGTRYFHGVLDGEDVSQAILYTDGRTGQPEALETLHRARGRGLGMAVMAHAAHAAVAAGCDLVFLVCDAAAGPYPSYADIGFRAAGRLWTFTRPPG